MLPSAVNLLGPSSYTHPAAMSQAKLTLRPPPNIDFVQGYPGIPPGAPDRPQAAVKGAIEVRVGPGGVKAKWVRIELRKIETLPGGGLANTFFDFVGQSPINLWQASGEYNPLQTQDFPFYIRIPESIPPSIALEKGAGIKYELIATLCIKGKKGFLRRDKHVILSTSAPIIIDKHELHSTWPVYSQPDVRRIAQDGVALIVERGNTCYGPGDRIAVSATVKSDSLHTVILRGFEFSLRESTVFRAGPNTTGKKGTPQVRVVNVAEQKVPVNATLYGGTQHKAELNLTVPSHHTSTTLNAARHIDITYVLSVKALMGTGKPVIMDLPVIISNWPRSVSVEAVRRIGLAHNVSSHQPQAPLGQIGRPITETKAMAVTPTSPGSVTSRPVVSNHPYSNPAPPPTSITDSSSEAATDLTRSANHYNTAPQLNGTSSKVDEFGGITNRMRTQSIDQSGGMNPQIQTIGGPQPPRPFADTATARPRSSSGRPGAPPANRLTVTNFGDDMPEEVKAQTAAQLAARSHTRNASFGTRSGTTSRSTGWMPAEEEKKRLYEQAQAKVELAHGGNIPRAASPLQIHSPVPIRHATSLLKSNDSFSARPSGSKSAWPSAEEEKAKLFNQAQDAVRKTQGISTPNGVSTSPSPAPTHGRSSSVNAPPPSGMSAGAALYSQALSNMARNASTGHSATSSISSVTPTSSTPQTTPTKRPTPHYPTAEEEKAALRRYHEAKAAVDRNQSASYGPSDEKPTAPHSAPTPSILSSPLVASPAVASPISYDALYPNNTPARVMSPPAPTPGELPPSFTPGPNGQPTYISEKERLRRHHEAQDAAALAAQQQQQWQAAAPPPPAANGPPVPGYYAPSSPPPFTPSQPNGSSSQAPLSEKEILRRHLEQQDRAAMAGTPPPHTPPRSGSTRGLPTPRAQPTPPNSSHGPRPLTAAEEKARLKAMYEAEERGAPPPPPAMSPPMWSPAPPAAYSNGVNGTDVHRRPSQTAPNYSTIPPPPPLAPRPPKEYIQETQEEDQNVAARIEAIDNADAGSGEDIVSRIDSSTSLELRAFSPFQSGFQDNGIPQYASLQQSQPPPRPPKFAINDP